MIGQLSTTQTLQLIWYRNVNLFSIETWFRSCSVSLTMKSTMLVWLWRFAIRWSLVPDRESIKVWLWGYRVCPNYDSIVSCGRVAVYLIDRRTHTITAYSAWCYSVSGNSHSFGMLSQLGGSMAGFKTHAVKHEPIALQLEQTLELGLQLRFTHPGGCELVNNRHKIKTQILSNL